MSNWKQTKPRRISSDEFATMAIRALSLSGMYVFLVSSAVKPHLIADPFVHNRDSC